MKITHRNKFWVHCKLFGVCEIGHLGKLYFFVVTHDQQSLSVGSKVDKMIACCSCSNLIWKIYFMIIWSSSQSLPTCYSGSDFKIWDSRAPAIAHKRWWRFSDLEQKFTNPKWRIFGSHFRSKVFLNDLNLFLKIIFNGFHIFNIIIFLSVPIDQSMKDGNP